MKIPKVAQKILKKKGKNPSINIIKVSGSKA